MGNALVQLIRDGKIQSTADLKKLYHQMVLKTHPDTIGSNMLIESYLEIRRHYEEATRYLAARGTPVTHHKEFDSSRHRLRFFQQWDVIEAIETPYAFHSGADQPKLAQAKQEAVSELAAWKPEWKELYRTADEESVRMQRGIPLGPYLKHAMGLNVRPLVHNIIRLHLTGQFIYRTQAKQNFATIMYRLEQEGFAVLKKLLLLLVEDMRNGP